MALSQVVKDTLNTLQSYYKSLYFLRGFLPVELKKHLNILENTNIHTITAIEAADLITHLHDSLLISSWYTHLVVYFLSGLSQFFTSDLIKQVGKLREQGLSSVDNLSIVLQCSDLPTGVTGLLLLQRIGITVAQGEEITPLTLLTLEEIVKVQQLNLPESSNADFYKAIIASSNPKEFVKGIIVLQSNPLCAAYIPKLACSPVPYELAQALGNVASIGFLPDEQERTMAFSDSEWLDEDARKSQLKQTISAAVIASAQPLLLSSAVQILFQNKLLEKCAFSALLTSESPVDLAILMLKFGANLDQQTLAQLEHHRKNLVSIERLVKLDESKQTNISYCQHLESWLLQERVSPSAQLMAVYDMYGAQFTSNATEYNSFLRVLHLLNDPEIWQRYGTEYVGFLNSFASRPEVFFIYAELLSVVAKIPKLVTAHNHGRLLTMLGSCKNPGELLQRCVNATRLTAVLLNTWVTELNSELDAASAVPSSQLRHRKPNNDRGASVVNVTTNITDLEGGTRLEKPKPTRTVTPYAAKTGAQNERASVVSLVTGVMGGLWAGAPSKQAQTSDVAIEGFRFDV
ncbi:MAG: hypothetical protein KBB94_09900 [Legionellaceae bacterium]|nr:hypothetical protein [Legionellaceae bacterium]MBP9775733.1 hypothetical protein [Legionellaceae bacterium]